MTVSSTSSRSGPLASTGLGSGLDVNAIVTKLMSFEAAPYNRATANIKSYNTTLSAVGQVQNLVSAMRDKAAAFNNPALWGTKSTTASDASVLSATATAAAAAGSYSMTVQGLAGGQTAVTGGFAGSTATLGEGTLKIELGSWDGSPTPTFTGKAGADSVTIDISGDTSLAAVRDKINAAKSGVTASIVNDANGARLSLQSTETGAANGFRITVTEATDDGNPSSGLSALSVDGQNAAGSAQVSQWAANAKATINGIAVESTSNKFENVSDGLSVTVSKLSATPVTLNVAADNAAIKAAFTDFVSAYNAMNAYVRTQTSYDAETKASGTLQGDASINGLMRQMRGVINQGSTASGEWSMLSQVGISMQKDGSLKVDDAKFTAAQAKPEELRKLFSGDGATTESMGFMRRFAKVGDQVVSSDGSLSTMQQSIKSRIKNATNLQMQLQTRMDQTESRLRAQYQALDKSMASLSSLSSYVVQQMAMLNSNA